MNTGMMQFCKRPERKLYLTQKLGFGRKQQMFSSKKQPN